MSRKTIREKIVEQLAERMANIVNNHYLVADKDCDTWEAVSIDGTYAFDYPSAWNITDDGSDNLTFTPRQKYRSVDDLTPIVVPYTVGATFYPIGTTGLTVNVKEAITGPTDKWVLRANQSYTTVKNSYPYFAVTDNTDETPHAIIYDGDETKKATSMERYDCELDVVIVINVDPEDRNEMILHKLQGEVELEYNRDINLRTDDCETKLSRNLWITGSNLLFSEGTDEIVTAIVRGHVIYQHAFRDPKVRL